jgi:hypothetical protein
MAGYSGTPLVRKLGIRPGSVVVILGAPAGFDELLEGLPDDVTLRTRARGRFDLAISFQTARRVLERRVASVLAGMDRDGALWAAWPKRASGVPTEVTEDVVREVALPIGLVDVKVCAIDETWSGLKLVWRRERR